MTKVILSWFIFSLQCEGIMKLRKVCLCLLVLACSVSFVWAANYQKTYQMSDEVWLRTNRLCITAGQLGPAPVSPISGAEILSALERLDYSSLSSWQREEYDYLWRWIYKGYFRRSCF